MRTITAHGITTARRFPTIDPAGIGRDGEDLSWQRDAACRDADPELFFPEVESGMHERITQAKRICFDCPVLVECGTYARERNEPFGIWGGQAEHHRPGRGRARASRTRQDRDNEIGHLSRAGLSAEQIANRLGIARRTVYRARARHRAAEVA